MSKLRLITPGEIILPRSFNHWLSSRGIRIHSREKRSRWLKPPVCWYGKGREFRVNMFGEFEMGDNDFDRWVNSTEVSFNIPELRSEMDAILDRCFWLIKNGE
jgi:hypothetical protein